MLGDKEGIWQPLQWDRLVAKPVGLLWAWPPCPGLCMHRQRMFEGRKNTHIPRTSWPRLAGWYQRLLNE